MDYTEKEIKFLKALKSQWVSQEEAFRRLNAVKSSQEATTPTVSPIWQAFWELKSGIKWLWTDIVSILQWQKQTPEEQWILSRTINRLSTAKKDIWEAVKWASVEEFAQHLIPWKQFTPTGTEKKLFTAVSKPITWTAGDIIISGAKTLMTNEREQEISDFVKSKPVEEKIKLAEDYFSKVVPNPTDRAFIMEALNYVPVPVLDDMLSGAVRGAKFVPEWWMNIGKAPFAKPSISPEWALPFWQGIRTWLETAEAGVRAWARKITPDVSWARDVVAEKLLSSQWKLPQAVKREIKATTGASGEDFALKNNLVSGDIDTTISNVENFKINKINEKVQNVANFWKTSKTSAEEAMAESLKRSLEKSLGKKIEEMTVRDIEASDPKIIEIIKWLDDFIKKEEVDFTQIEALKSLYDHYNPDNLQWNEWRLVDPAKHQNAAFRRETVQKRIEEKGKELWIDINKINKDIKTAYQLEKGLTKTGERMENLNIIGLGDTQIAILGSIVGGDLAGIGSLLVKKGLWDNFWFRWFLAKKLYTRANENIPLSNLSDNAPFNRVARLSDAMSAGGNLPLVKPTPAPIINARPVDSIMRALETGQIPDMKKFLNDVFAKIKAGLINEKEITEIFEKFPEVEQGVKKMFDAEEFTQFTKDMDEKIKIIENETIQTGEIPVEDLKPIIESIKNGEYTNDEITYIIKKAPREVKKELVNASRELRGMKPLVDEVKTKKGKPEKQSSNTIKQRFREVIGNETKSNPDELFSIAKKIIDKEIEDFEAFNPTPVITAKTKKGIENQVMKGRKIQNTPEQKAIEQYAHDRGITNDEAFDEIKALYEWATDTEANFIAKQEAGYDAKMARDAELRSLEEQGQWIEMRDSEQSPAPEDLIPETKSGTVGDMNTETPQVDGKTDDYLYHWTSQFAFEKIQKEWIKPQWRWVSSLSKTEEYSKNWAFPEATWTKWYMLRVKKDFMKDKLVKTTKKRPASDEMYEVLTKEIIPPEAIEVQVNNEWIPLTEYKK